MTIQNKIEAAKYSLYIRISLSVILVFLVIIFFMPGKSDNFILESITIILWVYYLAILIRMPYYFWYSDIEKNYLIFRYYNVHFLLSKFYKPKQLNILKGSIVDFKIESYLGGWRKILRINVAQKNEVAKYPPINISILNDEQIENLSQSLERWKKK